MKRWYISTKVPKWQFCAIGLETVTFLRLIFLIGILSVTTSFRVEEEENIKIADVFTHMQNTIESIKTIRYALKNTERIRNEYMNGHQEIVWSAKPKRSYVRFISPSEGAELLYIQGKNDNNAVYNPNGFPYFKLKLDPYGSLMRRNNHHTIHDIGFGYIGELLSFYFKKNSSSFSIVGEELWEGKTCWKIDVNNPQFGFKEYTVGPNETTMSLAQKFYINEYLLLERNDEVEEFGELEEGLKIKIPNSYAKKIVLLVDQHSGLPVKIEISDDKGLLESYKYFNIQLNPAISENDFAFKNLKFSF